MLHSVLTTTDVPMLAGHRDCDNPRGLVSVETARLQLLDGLSPVAEREEVPLARLAGRVLASHVSAAFSLPPFDWSAVDGYGLGSDWPGPFNLIGTVPAGAAGPDTIGPRDAVRLLTGAKVPGGVRAVAMQESCSVSPTSVVPPALVSTPVGFQASVAE